jgi:cob(I)alamin adenosyltransferase
LPEKASCHTVSPTQFKGLVSIFTGEGKGKTTAAIGLAVRAAGYGLKTYMTMFAKGGQFSRGEERALSCLPDITFDTYPQTGWLKKGSVIPEQKKLAASALERAKEAMLGGKYNIIVLDEINVAVDYNLVSVEDVAEFIREKPAGVGLVLTGRRAHPKLVEMADLVTDMVKIKHPYDKGINAREGIDF